MKYLIVCRSELCSLIHPFVVITEPADVSKNQVEKMEEVITMHSKDQIWSKHIIT